MYIFKQLKNIFANIMYLYFFEWVWWIKYNSSRDGHESNWRTKITINWGNNYKYTEVRKEIKNDAKEQLKEVKEETKIIAKKKPTTKRENLLNEFFDNSISFNSSFLDKYAGEFSDYERDYMLSTMNKDLIIWRLEAWSDKREDIFFNMQRAGLVRIDNNKDIVFNVSKAIGVLKNILDVYSLKEAFWSDIYKWPLEAVVLVQLYLKLKWIDVDVDWIPSENTFAAIKKYHTWWEEVFSDLEFKFGKDFDDNNELFKDNLDPKKDLIVGVLDFLLNQLWIKYNSLHKTQQQLAQQKYNPKNPTALGAIPSLDYADIDNQINILKTNMDLFKNTDFKYEGFENIIISVEKLNENINRYSEKEPNVDVTDLKKLANDMTGTVDELKEKYLLINYEEAIKIKENTFLNRRNDIISAINKLPNNLPKSVTKKDMQEMMINGLNEQANRILLALSTLNKLTKFEVNRQINEIFDKKILEITTKMSDILSSLDNIKRADIEQVIKATLSGKELVTNNQFAQLSFD